MPKPCGARAAFGELLLHAEALRKSGEYLIVVARFAYRIERALHRDHEAITRSRSDVVALEHGRRGKHDVSELGVRIPVLLVHHDRLGLAAPRTQEAVQVLVMMERVAAGPVDEPDVRIRAALPVEVILAARVLEHV